MTQTLLELYRHKTWATLRLIERCQELRWDQLDTSVAGTYGTIRETLHHLVQAEEGYYRIMVRAQLAKPLELPPLGDKHVGLDELAERIHQLGPRWELLALDRAAAAQQVTTSDGWHTTGAVPMAQAIHHADDHRTQVLTIIGALGLDVPDLDVWWHAIQSGTMVEGTPSASA
jgi:uncharacterized damage-inducible protein DinB